MSIEQIMAVAKEKFGLDLTEAEARNYLTGNSPVPDEMLDIVSGGIECDTRCPKCRVGTLEYSAGFSNLICKNCGARMEPDNDGYDKWRLVE